MMRLILAVSLCRQRSLRNGFIQGLVSLSPWARSLSDSASETSARKGIPRSAATVLARRKMASGISNVVFMSHAPIFMGASQLIRKLQNPKGDGTFDSRRLNTYLVYYQSLAGTL